MLWITKIVQLKLSSWNSEALNFISVLIARYNVSYICLGLDKLKYVLLYILCKCKTFWDYLNYPYRIGGYRISVYWNFLQRSSFHLSFTSSSLATWCGFKLNFGIYKRFSVPKDIKRHDNIHPKLPLI